ncbi:MAG: class I SAM-dependent methyltransferase [Thalassococcus sp.]|uniref:class I SAM-dependent methyltransferase n=1 Tax=Thalassococcus sp. TaxID=1928858 RepID=UPI001B053A14|nr:class I SAM-dependent methyltransferase [Thalassococcus sp.]MBO6867999.1 class I SAM-dependent methyltransferase [Thalassococcus sp.]
MFQRLKKRLAWQRDLKLSHDERAQKWGHRAYVGAVDSETWYGIGKRQYHFLTSKGLLAEHKFIDIACGSLRLGQFLIPMLDNGNYFGLEGEPKLVQKGIDREFLFDIIEQKNPKFSFNYAFDFSTFPPFDFAIAQSLFTHLTLEDIEKCFRNLRGKAHDGSKFYSTFFEGDSTRNPDATSHANKDWYYHFSDFEEIASRTGWNIEYIGDWGHERGQKMMCATITTP